MPLKCGIVGLPNVGKSTLFNALTNAGALMANYPFATKDPNVGVIAVPDPRLDELARLVQPQKVVPTSVHIVDIAGLIKGASKGEGLGNQFLSHIREVDAILHVVRCFDDPNITHVEGSVDPVRDVEIIDFELLMKDIETVSRRIEKLRKSAKSGDKTEKQKLQIAQQLLEHLNRGNKAYSFPRTTELATILLKEMSLLTDKKVLYVCNVDENSVTTGNAYTRALQAYIQSQDAEMVILAGEIEAELAALDNADDKRAFLEEMGLSEPGVYQLIRKAYHLLDLLTFFTAGEKEVRAWTVPRGATAYDAAGVIHSDFQRGFIRAEVISYSDFISYGSEHAVRQAGKLRSEGRDYVVQDGDIIHFLFNV